jgi:hypothetical protein
VKEIQVVVFWVVTSYSGSEGYQFLDNLTASLPFHSEEVGSKMEDHDLNIHQCENLKSFLKLTCVHVL